MFVNVFLTFKELFAVRDVSTNYIILITIANFIFVLIKFFKKCTNLAKSLEEVVMVCVSRILYDYCIMYYKLRISV